MTQILNLVFRPKHQKFEFRNRKAKLLRICSIFFPVVFFIFWLYWDGKSYISWSFDLIGTWSPCISLTNRFLCSDDSVVFTLLWSKLWWFALHSTKHNSVCIAEFLLQFSANWFVLKGFFGDWLQHDVIVVFVSISEKFELTGFPLKTWKSSSQKKRSWLICKCLEFSLFIYFYFYFIPFHFFFKQQMPL